MFAVCSSCFENTIGHIVAAAQNARQQMFSSYMGITASDRILHSDFHHAFCTRGQSLCRITSCKSGSYTLLNDLDDHIICQTCFRQDGMRYTLLFPNQSKK